MYKISFVILNYNNYDDTINCVDSIYKMNLKNIKYKIIIVDNKSTDNSGILLKEKFSNDPKVNVMLLDKNYGFSKGNNIGYNEACKDMPDTIMVLNNDIIFEDVEFLQKYLKYIKINNVDVVAPDIININNQHQNPLSTKLISFNRQKYNYYKELIYYQILKIPFVNKLVYNLKYNHEKKWYIRNYDKRLNRSSEFNENDFVPFGAFIIFTNNWLKNETYAFPSKTFMYGEEVILYMYIKYNKYKIGYCDDMKVKHLEGRSTSKVSSNKIEKSKFQTNNKVNACKQIIEFMKKYGFDK